ncbi:Metallo-dependent hydrolase [Cubamyces sp. BRFM 1775]|nr:Metallo-dependent hydrolase [Cubamyces sp. BRFM 1775]
MPTSRLFKGDFVHTPSLGSIEILRDYVLRTNVKGDIDYFAPASSPESQSISAGGRPTPIPTGSFMVPTFCDLHLHAPQFMYQGTGLHLELMKWLDEYAFKAEEKLDGDLTLAQEVYERLIQRLISSGTGAVMLFGTIKTETNLLLARLTQEKGPIRAFVGKLSMDISSRPTYVEASAQDSISAARDFCDRCTDMVRSMPEHMQLVEPVLTPRFVPTCSPALLSGLGSISEQKNVRIQSHMAEAHDQVQHVRQERGEEDMDVFLHSNLLTSRTVQAHCTFLSPEELRRLATTGTAVAHCPLSNAYFSAEPFRLREALDAGVRVGLGTDIAGGYSIDIMDAMRHAVTVSRMREGARIRASSSQERSHAEDDIAKPLSIDWKEALYLATRGGALALGLPKGCGTFTVGAPFDAQSIEVIDEKTGEGVGGLDFFELGDKPWDLTPDMVEKWWSLGTTRNRVGVWIQGMPIM